MISTLEAGGAQKVLVTMAERLSRCGLRVGVITLFDGSTDFFQIPDSVDRIVLPSSSRRASRFAALENLARVVRLRTALRSTKPATVMSFMTATNVLTVLATAGTRIRVVLSERNDPVRQPAGAPWEMLRRLLYRFADIVTANSVGALDAMQAYVPRSRLAYVPNPLPEAVSDRSADHNEPVILAVGRLTFQKGFDVLIRAFAAAAPRLPGWRLAVVGDGELGSELRALAADQHVASRIDWHGRLPDTAPQYRAASIFALPSRYEGTPNALLEAMAHGLAPVVTDGSPGPLDYVEDGVTGLVVPVDDPASLAKALERLGRRPALVRSLGRAARERIERDSNDDVLDTWVQLLGLGPGDRRGSSPRPRDEDVQ